MGAPVLKSDKEMISALVVRAQKGDERAMHDLVVATQDKLYRFCVYLTGDAPLAEDICQHTFVKVLERLDQVREPEHFIAWLYQSARNRYLDFLKSPRNSKANVSIDDQFDVAADSGAQPEALLELEKVMKMFSPDERTLLLLLYRDQYTYEEAAEIMKVSENTVRWMAHKCKKSLNDLLGDKND